MAGNQSNKFRVYTALYHINRAFNSIVGNCYAIEHTGLFRPGQMHELCGLVRELQAQLSHAVTDHMHIIEDEDWRTYGRVRIARDHRLNPERPPLEKPRQ